MGSLKGPKGPQDGKQCAMRSWDWTFYYEMISLWKKCVLLKLKVDKWQRKMIWDMFWPFSSSEGPPKAPWRSPIVPDGQPSVSWNFKKRYFTMRRFHYGNTRWHLHGKWTKDYLMIWGMFWLFSGSEGSPRISKSLQWFTINDVVCPENLGLNILLWDDFTMEKPGVTHKDGGKKNIWWF